jgi:hypothetical protein
VAVVAVSLLNHYITRVYEHERTEEGLCKDVSVASTGMQRDRRLQRSPHPPVAARYAASAGRGQGPPGHPAVDAAAYPGGLWRLETLSAVGDAARWRRRFGEAAVRCGVRRLRRFEALSELCTNAQITVAVIVRGCNRRLIRPLDRREMKSYPSAVD